MSVYTIGHSTRAAGELVALLDAHDVRTLVDVRRVPGSRNHPQFNRETLAATLADAGIMYRHEADLGGRRHARADSVNTAWRQSGFRGYADWMASDSFRTALERLAAGARAANTAILCAERDPAMCHRFLLSDAIVSVGIPVHHILGPGSTQPHSLHESARLEPDGTLVYPADDPQFGLL